MTTINEQRELVSSFALGAVREALKKGLPKQQVILEAKHAVAQTFGLCMSRSSLACHKAYAELEKLPYGGAINLNESTDRLIVINIGTGVESLVITLADIMKMMSLCGNQLHEEWATSPTIH